MELFFYDEPEELDDGGHVDYVYSVDQVPVKSRAIPQLRHYSGFL